MAAIKKVTEALELISGAGVKLTSIKHHNAMVDAIATALAEKDAELAELREDLDWMRDNRNKWQDATTRQRNRAERAEARVAELEKALERIIKVLPGDEQTDTVVTATNRLNAVLDIARRALTK